MRRNVAKRGAVFGQCGRDALRQRSPMAARWPFWRNVPKWHTSRITLSVGKADASAENNRTRGNPRRATTNLGPVYGVTLQGRATRIRVAEPDSRATTFQNPMNTCPRADLRRSARRLERCRAGMSVAAPRRSPRARRVRRSTRARSGARSAPRPHQTAPKF
jgi:hypothetical protein